MAARWDDGTDTTVREVFKNGVSVVGLIRAERVRLKIAQQRQRFRAVAGFAARETKSRQRSQSFNQRVNLGAQSAAGSPERLVTFFFGAPAAC